MPISRFINIELNLAILRYSGRITFSQMQTHIESFRVMEGMTPETKVILMVAEDTDVSAITSDDLQRISSNAPMSSNMTKHVIVAPETLAFGLSRMFALQQGKDAQEINVVRTLAEASDILKIDPSMLDEEEFSGRLVNVPPFDS